MGMITYRDIFIPFSWEDQVTLHQLLTNIAIQMNHQNPSTFKSEKYKTHEVVAHYAHALEIIQQRLAGPKTKTATSNGTIVTIICMIIYSVSTKALD